MNFIETHYWYLSLAGIFCIMHQRYSHWKLHSDTPIMPWSSWRGLHQTQRRRWENSWKFARKEFAYPLWAQGPTSSGCYPPLQIDSSYYNHRITCRRDPNLVPITDFFGSVRKVSFWEWEKISNNTSLSDWGIRQCCERVYYVGGGDND